MGKKDDYYEKYGRAYYEKNKETILARSRRYHILKNREYYEKNREKILLQQGQKRAVRKLIKDIEDETGQLDLFKSMNGRA